MADYIAVRTVQLDLCDLCIRGEGGECHVPGCSMWINRAPDLPLDTHPSFTIVESPDGPVNDIQWREILRAREAAHAKHGDNSIEAQPWDSDRWLSILVEEVGEAAHELTYDGDGRAALRSELVDVLAVASAWLAAIDATGGGAS